MCYKVAIYCLMQDDEVVYVGQSINPSLRIYDHSVGIGKKIFNDYAVKWVGVDNADYWEQKAIEYYQPKYNNQGTKKSYVPFNRIARDKAKGDAND